MTHARVAVALVSLVVASCATGPDLGAPDASGDAAAIDAAADARAPGDADGTDAHDAAVALDVSPDASGCATPMLSCGGACVDLQSDAHHCGDCATDCASLPGVVASSVRCNAGQCDVAGACTTGLAHCTSRALDGCETDVTTAAHCGDCTSACADPTPLCAATSTGNACASGCTGATPDRCATSCVDLRTSTAHCGTCDNACTAPSNATATCEASLCGFACDGGFHVCGGVCVRDDDATACGASCTTCATPAHGSAMCTSGTCGIACDAGFHDCAGQCVDSTLPASCGTSCVPCSTPSHATATCVGGTCGSTCASGYHRCGIACVDDTSPLSCGMLCTPCDPPPSGNGSATCNAGACDVTCTTGFHACGGDCADDTSLYTCGTSCVPCPNPANGSAICDGTSCGVTCNTGYHACGSTCANDASAATCGTACAPCTAPPPNANATCDGSRCGFVCRAGFFLSSGACVPGPRPIAPLSTALVSSRRPTLRWTLPSGMTSVMLDLCADRACSTPIGMTQTITGTSYAPTSDLPTGVVYWRIYAAGSASAASVWELFVGAQSAPIDTSWGTTPDLNGDGLAEVIVGAIGTVFVYAGTGASIGAPFATIRSPGSGYDNFGQTVASAGDVNGDGYADLAIGAPTGGATSAGLVYVHYGGPLGPNAAPDVTLVGMDGSYSNFGGYAGGAGDGRAVGSAGDVNGDGFGDLVVGAPNANRVYVFLGDATGLATTAATTLVGPAGGDFGWVSRGAGDVNGDGFGDVLATAYTPMSMGVGQAYLYLGGASGLSTTPASTLTGPDGFGFFGWSAANAGDVDGDGYADLVVGASDVFSGVGRVYFYLGGPSGWASAPTTTLDNPMAGGSDFGAFVDGAGDVDGDGYADLVVGAACSGTVYPNPCTIGYAYVYGGGATGITTSPTITWTGPDGYQGYFGRAVSAGGDVDGNGYADVLVTAHGTGRVFLFGGSASGPPSSASATIPYPVGSSSFGISIE